MKNTQPCTCTWERGGVTLTPDLFCLICGGTGRVPRDLSLYEQGLKHKSDLKWVEVSDERV